MCHVTGVQNMELEVFNIEKQYCLNLLHYLSVTVKVRVSSKNVVKWFPNTSQFYLNPMFFFCYFTLKVLHNEV